MRFRIRHADRIVGLFILLALTLVVAMLIFIAGNQRWFSHNAFYKSIFVSASGLTVGNSITMRGFELGKISKMSLSADNKVEIDFYVYEQYEDKVTKDSILELSTSPVGLGTTLQFHKGYSTEPLPEGSIVFSLDSPEGLKLEREGKVDRPKKDDSITSLLASINEMAALINDTLKGRGAGPINDILLDAAKTAHGLPGAVDKLKADLPEIVENLNASLKQVNGLTANLQTLSEGIRDPHSLVPTLLGTDNLSKQIDQTMVQLGQAMSDLTKITSGLAGEVPKLSSLIMEVRSAVTNAQDVMEGLKNNPLLKDGITKRPSQQAVFESLRREDF